MKSVVDNIMNNVVSEYDDLSSPEMESRITHYIDALLVTLNKKDEKNIVKITVNNIMDNVMLQYDELSRTEMEDKIIYYINALVDSLDQSQVKEKQHKTTIAFMNNIDDCIALAVYDQIEKIISIHIDTLLDNLYGENIFSGTKEDLRGNTIDAIMDDIGTYIAGCVFYKVRDKIDYLIGSLFTELRIEGVIPCTEVKDEVDDMISKIEHLEIKINSKLDLPLEGKRIGFDEVDPEEEPEDDPSMEDTFTEIELDQQLSTYFREGDMKMYTGYYPSPPKKRSRDNSSDDENSSCCRIKTN